MSLIDIHEHEFIFKLEELKVLYEVLKYQYIDQENEMAHKVINRISEILRKEGMI